MPNVQVVHLKTGEIIRRITLPGNLRAYQEAMLYAKVPGYLKSIAVDRGDWVKANDVLAEIEAPEMLADVAKFKAEADVAELEVKRVNEAVKKAPDLVMPQTVDAARGKSEIAKANLERIETLLGYSKIVAPSGSWWKWQVAPRKKMRGRARQRFETPEEWKPEISLDLRGVDGLTIRDGLLARHDHGFVGF